MGCALLKWTYTTWDWSILIFDWQTFPQSLQVELQQDCFIALIGFQCFSHHQIECFLSFLQQLGYPIWYCIDIGPPTIRRINTFYEIESVLSFIFDAVQVFSYCTCDVKLFGSSLIPFQTNIHCFELKHDIMKEETAKLFICYHFSDYIEKAFLFWMFCEIWEKLR